MQRNNRAPSHLVPVSILGLVTLATASVFTASSAEAHHHYQHRHYAAHHVSHDDDDSDSPKFSSIIVDGNSGTVLESNAPDGLRHPASLTKVMTLYLLFERLESGKMTLNTEMPVSEHAAEQDPTKLELRPGQTLHVEDAIKGIVTRSANDAAVVIAEAIGGDEDSFARMMTRKAHALGMSRTTYRNASGLPNDEQITTARDQSILGRAIQDRFPRYYHYFSTTSFTFRGETIHGHNHLLGSVDGVDGIKTGYTRASGFNLVTSMHRDNRFLVGVVMGGSSSGSRDATMRRLLAENLDRAASTRTAAAIADHGNSGAVEMADADPQSAPPAPARSAIPMSKVAAAFAAATAAVPPTAPAPLTAGVIQIQPTSIMPGSSEPMKPVRVKTVQIKATKLASAAPAQAAPVVTSAVPPASSLPETSNVVIGGAPDAEMARPDLPPQPPGHGTGNGLLGVLPASAVTPSAVPAPQAMAYAAPPPVQPQAPLPAAPDTAGKPAVVHPGWIVQVGALESESEAQQRIEAARNGAHGLLSKADPFIEPVLAKGDRKLLRARFAVLDRDQAEAVCKALKRSDISCITVHN